MAFSISSSSMMMMSVSSPTLSSSSSNSSLFNTTLKSVNLIHRSVGSNNNNKRRGLSCKCMFGLGVPKLPEVGRSIGKTFKSFQQAAKEFEAELKKEDPESLEDPKPAVNEIIIDQGNEQVKNTQVVHAQGSRLISG